MEIDRKNRTRRLIQLGALAEKYLHCEGVSPEEFEEKVKQLIAAHGREQAAVRRTDNTVNAFLWDLACLAGTGNGIDESIVDRLKVLATKLGYISCRLREGKK